MDFDRANPISQIFPTADTKSRPSSASFALHTNNSQSFESATSRLRCSKSSIYISPYNAAHSHWQFILSIIVSLHIVQFKHCIMVSFYLFRSIPVSASSFPPACVFIMLPYIIASIKISGKKQNRPVRRIKQKQAIPLFQGTACHSADQIIAYISVFGFSHSCFLPASSQLPFFLWKHFPNLLFRKFQSSFAVICSESGL